MKIVSIKSTLHCIAQIHKCTVHFYINLLVTIFINSPRFKQKKRWICNFKRQLVKFRERGGGTEPKRYIFA